MGRERSRRQPEVASVPVVVIVVVFFDLAFYLWVSGKPVKSGLLGGLVEIPQGVKPQPDLVDLRPSVEPRYSNLLPRAWLDLDREPVMVVTIDLRVEVVSGRSTRGVALEIEEVDHDSSVGVRELVLAQVLSPILKQVGCVVGVGTRGIVGQRLQSLTGVVREPEDEPVEVFLQEVVVVDELLQLLVLDAVWGIAANKALAKKDGDEWLLLEGEEVEITVGQLELHPIDGEPSVGDVSRRFECCFE